MVAVTGLITTDMLYFHFAVSFWVSFWGSGAVFQAASIFTSKRGPLQYWHD